jgi:hypothetical protein
LDDTDDAIADQLCLFLVFGKMTLIHFGQRQDAFTTLIRTHRSFLCHFGPPNNDRPGSLVLTHEQDQHQEKWPQGHA